MNWKLRLKNKATLLTLLLAFVTFVYAVLAALGITPSITQEQANNLVVAIVTVLMSIGIVVDPTTKGVSDSDRAKTYTEPASTDSTESEHKAAA